MREILFRGKTVKGKWIQGSLVVTNQYIKHKPKQHTKTWIVECAFGNGGWFNVIRRSYVYPKTVGQYTGLKDKSGKKIFEGDIIQYIATNMSTGVALFENGKWCVEGPFHSYSLNDALNAEDFQSIEIIGNIHNEEW